MSTPLCDRVLMKPVDTWNPHILQRSIVQGWIEKKNVSIEWDVNLEGCYGRYYPIHKQIQIMPHHKMESDLFFRKVLFHEIFHSADNWPFILEYNPNLQYLLNKLILAEIKAELGSVRLLSACGYDSGRGTRIRLISQDYINQHIKALRPAIWIENRKKVINDVIIITNKILSCRKYAET